MLAGRGGGYCSPENNRFVRFLVGAPPTREALSGGGGPSCYGEDNKPSVTPSMTNTNYRFIGSELEILKTFFAHLSFQS